MTVKRDTNRAPGALVAYSSTIAARDHLAHQKLKRLFQVYAAHVLELDNREANV